MLVLQQESVYTCFFYYVICIYYMYILSSRIYYIPVGYAEYPRVLKLPLEVQLCIINMITRCQ